MATATKDTAAETPETKVVHVASMDAITAYVQANGVVDLDAMQSAYEESGQDALPICDANKMRTLVLEGGRSKKIPVDIGWANRDKFVYAWLTPEDQRNPKFAGFRPVTKDCPAARAGGKAIPETYYGGKSYIGWGTNILHFTKLDFAQSVKASTNRRALSRLESFKPGGKSVDVKDDQTGLSAGGVTTKEFEFQKEVEN